MKGMIGFRWYTVVFDMSHTYLKGLWDRQKMYALRLVDLSHFVPNFVIHAILYIQAYI